MKEQIERVAVKDEYKWDLTPIYENDDLWYKDLEIAFITGVIPFHMNTFTVATPAVETFMPVMFAATSLTSAETSLPVLSYVAT